MEGLNFLNFAKNAFSDLMRVVKKEIEEALTEENIKKVLKPLEKATKTVNKELDKYFEKPILKNKNQKLFPKNKNLEAMNEKELVKEIIKTENKEYAEEVFLCLRNKIKSKKAIVEFVMDDKRVFTYTFSEDFLEKVNKFLSGEEKHGKTYGSDAELYKIFTEKKVKKVKFIYIEEGKRDKGKFSKWYHSIDLLDLREIQIMRNETDLLIERDDLPNFIHKKLENDKTPTKEDIKKIRLNQRTEHCLVNSLKVLGASEEELAKARNYIGENSFRTKDLTPLGSLLNCFFKLTVISHDDKSGQSKQFNKKSKELIPNIKTYHLVLYDGHYMPNIIHDVTAYAINNYERVKNFENWNRVKYIQKKNGREVAQRVKKCETDTIKVINALHDSKRFYWNDTIHEKTEHRHELILTEKTVNECQAKLKIIKPKKVNEDYIFDADFESLVSGVERHIPFMLGCVSQKGDYKKVYLADKENLEKNHIFERMLDDIIKVYGEKIDKENDLTKGKEITDLIEFKQNKTKEEQIISHKTNNNTRNTLYNRKKKNFIIYFHNLKYDYSLIQAAKFVNISNVCEKQGQLYSATIVFRGYVFELRDSYKMISLPLKDFKSSLDLESGKKDFSLYEYFTTDNFTNKLARIEDLQKFDKKMTVEKMRKRNMEKFLVEIKGGTFVKILDFYID